MTNVLYIFLNTLRVYVVLHINLIFLLINLRDYSISIHTEIFHPFSWLKCTSMFTQYILQCLVLMDNFTINKAEH